jgi:hypothetical protein
VKGKGKRDIPVPYCSWFTVLRISASFTWYELFAQYKNAKWIILSNALSAASPPTENTISANIRSPLFVTGEVECPKTTNFVLMFAVQFAIADEGSMEREESEGRRDDVRLASVSGLGGGSSPKVEGSIQTWIPQ